MEINYLPNKKIDRERWDQLIEESSNGRIYAYSWYLDIVTKHWNALIGGDYEFVMPLPVNSKYGITYSMTPYFVQQLGIFSRNNISESTFCLFIKEIPKKIKYLNLNINSAQPLPLNGISFTSRTNFILNINKSYNDIRMNYKADAHRNLNKSCYFQFTEIEDIESVVQNYRDWNGHLVPFGAKEYATMTRLMHKAKQENHLIICQLTDEKSEILASGFFLTSHGRSYYIASSQSPAGRANNASHFFIDCFIKQYCEKIKIFDFEGSNIPGIAAFFKKWGSVPEYYLNIEFSKFPVNLFELVK